LVIRPKNKNRSYLVSRTSAWKDVVARRTTDDHSRFLPARAALASRLAVLLATSALVGCSGRGTYITGGPSSGQLKSSLSRLEFENDQLKTQVARLKEENRQFEDRLVQEQLHNGEITARLDDMRNMMRDGGYGDLDADRDAPVARPRTLPAGRESSPRRKPPAAQISRASEIDDIPPIRIDDAPLSLPRSSDTRRSRSSSTGSSADEDLGLSEKNMSWTPIAQGASLDAPPKR
jgi:hypothetical protein